jgi:RNA ligase
MLLNELINPASLAHDMAEGFIRMQRHPDLPLVIYNYTEKAQFAKHWNKATLQCRGLIVNSETGQVVARPFPKFFNWDEPKPKGSQFRMSLDEPVVVTDKLDGSLGILYHGGPLFGHAIATRGSFTSDQAVHATKIWRDRYNDEFSYRMNPRLTYLFEIIYPANRIVVDYNGLDDLVLIGAVDIGGFVYGPESVPGWPGPSARVFPYRTLREAVQARPRAGKEGLVVRSLSDSLMLKIKQEDYVSLHRIVTGLNEKEIWRRSMKADLELPPEIERMSTVLKDVPDELEKWVISVSQDLFEQVNAKYMQADRVMQEVRPNGPVFHQLERSHRKEFASRIKHLESWLQKTLWIMYDGNIPLEFLWRTVEPRGDVKK